MNGAKDEGEGARFCGPGLKTGLRFLVVIGPFGGQVEVQCGDCPVLPQNALAKS